ncbi:MAG: chemotaxis protein CheW [Cyclobacteriaceae bacterium]|nr:chemotaxis protein CheW [Cyclobacteriaceae bacterium]
MTKEIKGTKEITLEEIKQEVSFAQQEKIKSSERLQLIVFKLAGEEYALPIDDIKEVVITPGIAKIPQTPDYIKGVANIRGNIIAIMDMEERLKLMKEEREITGSYTLVIASEKFKLGILVKEVPNTLNTFSSEIDTTSNIMQFSTLEKECIKGVVKVNSRLIILVDIFKLIENEDLNNITTI